MSRTKSLAAALATILLVGTLTGPAFGGKRQAWWRRWARTATLFVLAKGDGFRLLDRLRSARAADFVRSGQEIFLTSSEPWKRALQRARFGKRPPREIRRHAEAIYAKLAPRFDRAINKGELTDAPSAGDAHDLVDTLLLLGKIKPREEGRVRHDAATRAHLWTIEPYCDRVEQVGALAESPPSYEEMPRENGDPRDPSYAARQLSTDMAHAARDQHAQLPVALLARAADLLDRLEALDGQARERAPDIDGRVQALREAKSYDPTWEYRPRDIFGNMPPADLLKLIRSGEAASFGKAWRLEPKRWDYEIFSGLRRSFGYAIHPLLSHAIRIRDEGNPFRAAWGLVALAQAEKVWRQARTEGIKEFPGSAEVAKFLRQQLPQIDRIRAELTALHEALPEFKVQLEQASAE